MCKTGKPGIACAICCMPMHTQHVRPAISVIKRYADSFFSSHAALIFMSHIISHWMNETLWKNQNLFKAIQDMLYEWMSSGFKQTYTIAIGFCIYCLFFKDMVRLHVMRIYLWWKEGIVHKSWVNGVLVHQLSGMFACKILKLVRLKLLRRWDIFGAIFCPPSLKWLTFWLLWRKMSAMSLWT